MIYCGINLDDKLAYEIKLAAHYGIEVQVVTETTIIVTFRLTIWKGIAAGNGTWVDIATYHLHRLYKASNISVLAVFPGSLAVRMGPAKAFEYINNPYKFNENIYGAIRASIACAGADIDSTLYI